jgi:hypothetical protein
VSLLLAPDGVGSYTRIVLHTSKEVSSTVPQHWEKLTTSCCLPLTMPLVTYEATVEDQTGRSHDIEVSTMLSLFECSALLKFEHEAYHRAMSKVISKAERAILTAGPWECKICRQPNARHVNHLPSPSKCARMLGDGRSKLSWDVSDIAIPVCGSVSCSKAAQRYSNRLSWSRGTGRSRSGYCENCNKHTTRVRVCSRCKEVIYCSKACQVAHWKTGGHKQACNPLS